MVESDQASRNGTAGDPLIGKVLSGRFRVLEKLGAGGMGTVYKAVQTPLDRMVALKVLNSNYDSRRDPGFQRRFFLEASVTSKLKHPNTITVIDYGKTDDGIYYIAMEYVEGITLAQVLTQEGTLPWNRALHVAQQIARSLREAHKAGIIHRDLKPANVMLCNEETDHDLVKVLDFGLVKSFLPDSPAAIAEGADITQAGVFLGSPQYMAPEQARNLADPRSDIYSLGVVLYQMLIGQPPFYAEQSIDVIVKHMKEPPKPFGAARPDLSIPPEVEALVMKCLEKSPDRRYQSMDELLEAMRAAAQGNGLSGAFSGSRSAVQSGAHRIHQSGPRPQPGSGAFRSPVQSGVRSQVVNSGPHKVPSGPHKGVSGPHKGASGPHKGASGPHRGAAGQDPAELLHRASTIAVDVTLDDEAGTESDIPMVAPGSARPQAPTGGRKLLPLWIFLGSAAVGAAVIFFLITRSSHPAQPPLPAPELAHEEPVKPPPPQEDPHPPAEPPAEAQGPRPIRVHVQSEPPGATVLRGSKTVGQTPTELELPAGPDGRVKGEQLTLTHSGYLPETVIPAGSGPEIFIRQTLRKRPPPPPPNKGTPPNKGPKNNPNSGYKKDPYE